MLEWLQGQDPDLIWLVLVPAALILVMVLAGVLSDMIER